MLILILLALGAYALLTLRDNQRNLDALMAGPVRQAELAADLDTTVWTAHAKLYRLAATAANETDDGKIKAMAKDDGSADSLVAGLAADKDLNRVVGALGVAASTLAKSLSQVTDRSVDDVLNELEEGLTSAPVE